MVKKNVHGGLKVFLLLLFTILLSISSTCYAVVRGQMTEDMAQYLFDYTMTTRYQSRLNFSNWEVSQNSQSAGNWYYTHTKQTMYNSCYKQEYFSQFAQLFNNADSSINGGLGVEHYIFFNTVGTNGTSTIFACVPNNNGIGNDVAHLTIRQYNSNSGGGTNWKNLCLDARNGEYNNDYKTFFIYVSSSSMSLNGARFSLPLYFNVSQVVEPYLNFYGSSDTLIYSPYNFTCLRNQSIYSTPTLNTQTNNNSDLTQPYILVSYYVEPTPSITPTPEGTGSITSPSGDVTGNINLSGIESGLTNIVDTISGEGQAICDTISGEGQAIRDQISGDTDKIIGFLSDDTFSGDFEGEIDDMVEITNKITDPTVNFFSWLIDNIRSVLNSTGNYELTIDFMGETYVINSDFFVLPDGDFKEFLRLSFIAWFSWRIIKKIRYIVYAIKCVKITDALHEVDFNPNIL